MLASDWFLLQLPRTWEDEGSASPNSGWVGPLEDAEQNEEQEEPPF